MHELITITTSKVDDQQVNTVNAEDLWTFLCQKSPFRKWINRRIKQYGFIENLDYLTILSDSTGGRPVKEYHLTLDMAKELSMVERNAKGKEARQYFLKCEKTALEALHISHQQYSRLEKRVKLLESKPRVSKAAEVRKKARKPFRSVISSVIRMERGFDQPPEFFEAFVSIEDIQDYYCDKLSMVISRTVVKEFLQRYNFIFSHNTWSPKCEVWRFNCPPTPHIPVYLYNLGLNNFVRGPVNE